MAEIHFEIDGQSVSAPSGTTILDAAHVAGIHIPTLCYLKDINKSGICKMCVVQVDGSLNLVSACTTKIKEGMCVETNNEYVVRERTCTLEKICASHNMNCEYCPRYSDCEFHALVQYCGIDDRKYLQKWIPDKKDESAQHIIKNYSRCIHCMRCLKACELQTTGVIHSYLENGKRVVGPSEPLGESACIGCGQCIMSCPTGALYERDETQAVWNALRDHTVDIILAPEVGMRFAELIGCRPEEKDSCKLAAILRKIGFRNVYLAPPRRICPAVRRYCSLYMNMEYGEPELRLLPNSDSVIVDVEPCVAYKLYSNERADIMLTTRELKTFLLRACISRASLNHVWEHTKEEPMDTPPYSLEDIGLIEVCGMNNVKQALKNKDFEGKLLLSCPKGCLFGGGQPRPNLYKKE